MELQIAATFLLLVALAFLSTVDAAFVSLSDVALRRLSGEREDAPARGSVAAFLREIQEDRPRFRFTLGGAIQVLLVAISVLVSSVASLLFPGSRFLLIAFGAGVVLVLLFRQLLPRLIAARDPERTLLLTLPVVRPLYRVLALLGSPFHRRANERAARRLEAQSEADETDTDESEEADIQALIDVGEEEGILEEDEGELIQTIIEFGDTRVNEVMTPRTDIVAIPVTATIREARDRVIESKHSRLPVYRDQIDNVEGIIYVRDLLLCWADNRETESIETLLRPAYFVPETKPIADLLEEMQKTHVQLAMVTDEYGGVEGLVTVEDILEEIVGEIEDEDTEQNEVVEIVEAGNGYYDVLGSTEIGKIENLFDFEIEDDDFTTIAGLVIKELGRVPAPGAHFNFRGLDVEVLEADERRIGRLRLRLSHEDETVTND